MKITFLEKLNGVSNPDYKLDVQIEDNDGISARFEGTFKLIRQVMTIELTVLCQLIMDLL